MREAQAMGRLTHPHIVSIFDIGEQDGSPYIIQELMGGGDVEGLLEDAEEPPPLTKALEIGVAVCRGLEYAHEQGVVHRDLKPGNVWLTADGTAKIGDFGLAIDLGRSRLTQHGMMVGTFGYMPPEQALGGEVTPKADLYSLGAMLYELVTGRAPFKGDTPTAVISQHLNTPPVAPSYLTEHCPPELEDLILRLLEKDPEKRPASATEARTVLERIDPEGRSRSHSEPGANPLDRLARGVFVGRERELEQLREAMDNALNGRGSVVMLVGEPGIGKTRTLQELETYARLRGADVYWGRTHESSGMPAYWPWIQVGRAWGARHGIESGRQPEVAPQLVRLFPELRRVVPDLPEEPERESEAAQFLLFDAYTQFVRAQAAETPWLIFLDDLHWADKPTLQLLAYAARELGNMRVLLVGTYRDTELARTHPLSESLAELNRESGFLRIPLRGLAQGEVAEYVTVSTNVKPAAGVIERIHEETEGNPYFLSEVVNLMAEEGTLTAESVGDIALPDGVKEALGRRLNRLSEEANELLQVAAVVGREFNFETLALVREHEDEELLRLLETGLAARVIEESERAGVYRFTHALIQETLLDELSTTRQVRLHGQIAEALERRWGDRAEERAPRLALHYLESATLTQAHAEKAYRYAKLAAEQARRSNAWGEAARLYEHALAVDEGAGAEPDLLMALGRCYLYDGTHRSAWRSLLRAQTLYRERGDHAQAARATLLACRVPSPEERRLGLIDEALAALPVSERGLLARLRLERLLHTLGGRTEIAKEKKAELGEIERLAAEIADPEVEAILPYLRALRAMGEGEWDRAISLARPAHDRFRALGDTERAARVLGWESAAYLRSGRVDECIAGGEQALAFTRRYRLRFGEANACVQLGILSRIRGISRPPGAMRLRRRHPMKPWGRAPTPLSIPASAGFRAPYWTVASPTSCDLGRLLRRSRPRIHRTRKSTGELRRSWRCSLGRMIWREPRSPRWKRRCFATASSGKRPSPMRHCSATDPSNSCSTSTTGPRPRESGWPGLAHLTGSAAPSPSASGCRRRPRATSARG